MSASRYVFRFRSWQRRSRGLDERRTEFAISTGAIALLAVVLVSVLVAAGCIPADLATDAIARLGAKALRF